MSKDASGWTTRLTAQMIDQYTASGAWRNTTIAQLAQQRAGATPERVCVVDGVHRMTYARLFAEARRIAAGLRDMGLVPGDVVSFQLPNWWEAVVVNLAAAMGGWVANPIVPIYRDAEVGFILDDSHSSVIFLPERFRSIDYLAMMQRLAHTSNIRTPIVTVRAQTPGAHGLSDFSTLGNDAAPWEAFDVSPNAVKLALYTSGTTGRPKGVLHSHNTLATELDAVSRFWQVDEDDVVFMPSPVTHITGYTYALDYVFVAGVRAVLMDQWEATAAVALARREHATLTVAATPFLAEFVDAVAQSGEPLPAFRMFASGGAPVPPELVHRAARIMPDCVFCRVYGSSETPTVSLGVNQRGEQTIGAETDGRIFNNEVRIADPVTGAPLPAGQVGEILARGPEIMLGYCRDTDTLDAFDADGFFRSGDLGWVSDDGVITVTGRKKDLIIRGGENLSPKEIEDILHTHPAIAEAAVVAMPHARLGETPCAWVVLREGTSLTFETLIEWLETARLARQKLPERLFVVEAMPKTPSGKILKHVLRTRSAEAVASEAPSTSATSIATTAA
ncbi:AMP-binding protein [Pandoraea pnomenusa]|uniref:AMP-binding protein n=1 Tax=Pandoraea pnomenusa TaxID=93220 RepID=UPI003341CD34